MVIQNLTNRPIEINTDKGVIRLSPRAKVVAEIDSNDLIANMQLNSYVKNLIVRVDKESRIVKKDERKKSKEVQ